MTYGKLSSSARSVPQHPVHGLAGRNTEQPMLAVGTGRHPRMPRNLVDGLFFWETEHCRNAYESERTHMQLPPELRKQ